MRAAAAQITVHSRAKCSARCECVRWLAESNYEVHFDPSVAVSERIIFPVSSNESNGMEDARFVRFVEDDGSVIYYATYTAYNGRAILPQLLETTDFLNFRVAARSTAARCRTRAWPFSRAASTGVTR